MSTIPPTLPFKIASAYGVPIAQRPAPAVQTQPAAGPISFRQPDTTELTTKANTTNLVAARVNQPIDFLDTEATPAKPAALPFYRHPADTNTAATSVTLGQRLDLNG